jgi:hypothetical protein
VATVVLDDPALRGHQGEQGSPAPVGCRAGKAPETA